ncbi:hypothetical protein RJ639_026950 [Escallonia herrerae]|uniref:Uncharacterized protein n=1 Tax=Escallonia herrerae TaxID=1293975 RepID=A0AA88X6V2_9ASTE|nr:hypothetical protein RJ639_026950 [Escallonia herrerae]
MASQHPRRAASASEMKSKADGYQHSHSEPEQVYPPIEPQHDPVINSEFQITSTYASSNRVIMPCLIQRTQFVAIQLDALTLGSLKNSSGRCRGSITNSFNVSLTFSSAPISSNVTPISLGGITSPRSLFSNSFSVTTSYEKSKTIWSGESVQIDDGIGPVKLLFLTLKIMRINAIFKNEVCSICVKMLLDKSTTRIVNGRDKDIGLSLDSLLKLRSSIARRVK